MSCWVWRLGVLCAGLGVASGASGQQAVTFEFTFSNPGARSLGLGGAFVALADDATAAYANPAGLVRIVEPEVSIEGRSWSYTTPFTVGGRAEGQPTGVGLDTTAGLRRADSTADFTRLSFVSVVVPLDKWSIALYRHQLANFESAVETQGLFANGSVFANTRRAEDQRGFFSVELVNYGVSAGFRAAENLSLGLGVSYVQTDLTARGEAYRPVEDSMDSYFRENAYLAEDLLGTVSATSDDADMGLIMGFLWRAGELWSLGGFYRFGIEADLDIQTRLGPASPEFPAEFRESAPVSFPDVYGLGIGLQSRSGRLTSILEWDHVEYSTIFESLDDPNDAIPDGDEVHLGFEYAFLESTPIVALRVGAWLDPDHRIRATNDDPVARAALPPGDDEMHLAAGVGVAFDIFQIDLGIDVSNLVDTLSVSAIYSF